MNLEYLPIKEHFQSCRLSRYSRSVYDNYEWSVIMSMKQVWYAQAEEALVLGILNEAAAIGLQWLISFVDAFDNDAFAYDDEGWEFSLAIEDFSDLILRVYDNVKATEELKYAIVSSFDELNRMRKLYDYCWLDINEIIKQHGWPIEVIDFKDLDEAALKAREVDRKKALEEAEKEKKLRYIADHFVCEYEAPAQRFQRQRVLYPLFQTKSRNFSKRLMPGLRKAYNKCLERDNKDELMQRLDGYARSAHLRAVRGEMEVAILIIDNIIRFINEIYLDDAFVIWIGNDNDLNTELNKILRNAERLMDYFDRNRKKKCHETVE